MKRPTALAQKLIAPQQQLGPQQARPQSVAMPHALPQQLRYGNVQPGIAQSSRFTGGVAHQQPMSEIFPAPDYRAPFYENLGLTVPRPIPAPVAAPQTAAPPGSALGSLLSGGTGGAGVPTSSPLAPPPHSAPPAPSQTVAPIYGGSNSGTSGEPPQRLNPAYAADIARITRAAQFGTRIGGSYYQR